MEPQSETKVVPGKVGKSPMDSVAEFSGLASDSREVKPGYLFAALSGTRANGAAFMSDAVKRGAVAVLARPEARSDAEKLGVHVKAGYGWGKILLEIFEKTVEQTLVQPTFITDHPTEVSPLARANDLDAEITDRFELFVGGKEIANGFSELNDPEDQAARFKAQVDAKDSGDDEAMHFDADYIRALEVGLPPTGGLGVGIDRMVMLLAGVPSIRDVLLFPYMRPQS